MTAHDPDLLQGGDRKAGFRATELGLLLTLAVPNVMSTAAETMLSFVDYAIVSQLGPVAQAAVQSGTMVFFSAFALLLGTMLCVTTVVSQSLGAGRLRDCSSYAWQGVWLCLLFGILGFVVWPLTPGLYRIVGHAPDVQIMEVEYTRIRMLGLGPAGISLALAHFCNGVHLPKQNAVSMVLANVVNAVFSYGLVFGAWGLPQMGIAGAAWASVASTLFRVAWLLVYMCAGRQMAGFAARETIAWDTEKVRRLLWVGWPSGVSIALDIWAWAFFLTFLVGQFGTKHLAASATCWRFTELSFMPALGIGFAVSTLVGRDIGEGRLDRARRRARLGTLLNMAYMGSMGLIFVVFGRGLMDLFTDDPEVIQLGVGLLILVAVFQLFDAVAITYSNALRGAGDTRWTMVVGAALSWVIMIGGGAVVSRLAPEWGSAGPWVFATLFVIAIGLALWARWRSGRWETIDVIGRAQADATAVGLPEAEALPVAERIGGPLPAPAPIGSPSPEA